MRFNPLEGQLERLARTLTEQFGVSVVCHGTSAYTDGKTIVLPTLPEPMDEPLERMIVGFLDHEMAHVACSDFKEVEKFSTQYPGAEAMLNVVEDALIEKLAMQRWPGVRANLDALFRQVRGRVQSALRKATPFRRFTTAVYLRLSHHQQMLGLQRELEGFEDLLDQYPQVQTTADSAALAGALLNRWRHRQRQQSPPPEPSGGTQQQGSANGRPPPEQASGRNPAESTSRFDDRSGCSGATDGPESEDSTTGTSTQSDCDEQDQKPAKTEAVQTHNGDDEADRTEDEVSAGDQTSSAPGESTPSSAPDGDEASASDGVDWTAVAGGAGGEPLLGEVISQSIARAVSLIKSDEHYRVYTKRFDRIEVVPDADETAVRALLECGADTVRRLRRGLANALRSAEKRWWREDQLRGHLSPKTLHRLCIARPCLDVFRTRSTVQGKSTAVSIVLDASGSMTTHKMDVARDAVRALLEALHDLRIPTEAITFTNGDTPTVCTAAEELGVKTAEVSRRYGRVGRLEIDIIKRFEDSLGAALQRLPNVMGTGGTPLGEGMQIGAQRLVVRSENRKILLVLTDGRPGCEGNTHAALNHAKHVAGKIAASGIELVGVGIVDSSLTGIVADTIVVQQIEELPVQLCKLLGRTLKKGVCRVG